jgi:hypothetical protein
MENNKQQEQQQLQLSQMLDAYNDEYWMKKYGVSTEELKANPNIDLSAKIIAVTNQREALVG